MQHYGFTHHKRLTVDARDGVGAESLNNRCASYCSAQTRNQSMIHLVFRPEPSGAAHCYCGMPLTADAARENSTASSLTCGAHEPWQCGTVGVRDHCKGEDMMISESGHCTARPKHDEFEDCTTASSRHCGTTGAERLTALSACPLTLSCPSNGDATRVKTPIARPEFTPLASGRCDQPVATRQQCATAAKVPSVDEIYSRELPKGCYQQEHDGRTLFNAHPAAVGECGTEGIKRCLCKNDAA